MLKKNARPCHMELRKNRKTTELYTELWVIHDRGEYCISFLEPLDINHVPVLFREMAEQLEKDLKDE